MPTSATSPASPPSPLRRIRDNAATRPRPPLALIALGAALGGPTRWMVGNLVPATADGLPWATLIVNITGAFALGLLAATVAAAVARGRLGAVGADRLLATFGVGFMGAYTTFSSFAVDATQRAEDGRAATALLAVVLTMAGAPLAAALGRRCGTGARPQGRSTPAPSAGAVRP